MGMSPVSSGSWSPESSPRPRWKSNKIIEAPKNHPGSFVLNLTQSELARRPRADMA
jgi:hypothetical protein